MTKIKVLDAICGSGKSSYVKKMILDNPKEKYLYVAPYLSECHRFAGTKYCEKDKRKKPILADDGYNYVMAGNDSIHGADLRGMRFRHPDNRNKKGSKELSLCKLIENGDNIVSTHALFTDLGSNALDAAKDYTLIIDETVNVYELDNVKVDVDHCLSVNFMSVSKSDGITLVFESENYLLSARTGAAAELNKDKSDKELIAESRYADLAQQCELGQLLYIDGKAVIWELSVSLLKAFKEVWVCTYMFEGSDMCSLLKKYNVPYEYYDFGNRKRSVDVAHLIEVVDDKKLNLIGEIVSLSSTTSKIGAYNKLESTKTKVTNDFIKDSLKNNLHNLFNQKWKAKSTDRLWTSYKNQSSHIANKKYGKQFLAYNYKATNDFANVHHVAFMIDVFQNPLIQAACYTRDIATSNEHFAISTLIQFIFRSAIRKGEPIKLYLPSLRMRNLLERWKQGEFD